MNRVVCVAASMLDDEAEAMVQALLASRNDGLVALANEIQRVRATGPYIVSMDTEWQTPACKAACDACDVEGCNHPADPDSFNNFCKVHEDFWIKGAGDWDRPVEELLKESQT